MAPRSGVLTSSEDSRPRKRKNTAQHPGMILGPANQKRRNVLTNQSQGRRVTCRSLPPAALAALTDMAPRFQCYANPAPPLPRAPGPADGLGPTKPGSAGLLVHHGRPRPPRPGLRPRPPRGSCLPCLWAERTLRGEPFRAPCACRREVCGRAVGGKYPAARVELRTAWRIAAVPRSAVHTATHADERRKNTK